MELNEAIATHDLDFAEHLGLERERTFHAPADDSTVRRRKVNTHAFTHMYVKRAGHQDDGQDKDRLHILMKHHGYTEQKGAGMASRSRLEFKRSGEHSDDHVVAHLHPKTGSPTAVFHHEKFHLKESAMEMGFKKQLRKIVPKTKPAPDVEYTDKDSRQGKDEKAFVSLHKILQYPSSDENEDTFIPSMKKNVEGPDAGYKEPIKSVKEDVEELVELDRKTLKSYLRKAGTSSNRAWDKGDKEEDKAKDRWVRKDNVKPGEKPPAGTKYFTTKK